MRSATKFAGRDRIVQKFQLTRSMRCATSRNPIQDAKADKFQLTRSMRSATPRRSDDNGGQCISTHTLHAERDFPIHKEIVGFVISTHTLHAERDRKYTPMKSGVQNFNSHAPCGARRLQGFPDGWTDIFQLTRSMRSATAA